MEREISRLDKEHRHWRTVPDKLCFIYGCKCITWSSTMAELYTRSTGIIVYTVLQSLLDQV